MRNATGCSLKLRSSRRRHASCAGSSWRRRDERSWCRGICTDRLAVRLHQVHRPWRVRDGGPGLRSCAAREYQNASSNESTRVDAPCHWWAHQGGHGGSWGADGPSTEELKSRVGRHKARALELSAPSDGRGWVESIRAAVTQGTRHRPRRNRAAQGAALCAFQQRRGFRVVAQRAELFERAPAKRVQRQRFAKVCHCRLNTVGLSAHDAQQELAGRAAGNLPAAASETRPSTRRCRLRHTSSPTPLVSACSASDSSPISTHATANR